MVRTSAEWMRLSWDENSGADCSVHEVGDRQYMRYLDRDIEVSWHRDSSGSSSMLRGSDIRFLVPTNPVISIRVTALRARGQRLQVAPFKTRA